MPPPTSPISASRLPTPPRTRTTSPPTISMLFGLLFLQKYPHGILLCTRTPPMNFLELLSQIISYPWRRSSSHPLPPPPWMTTVGRRSLSFSLPSLPSSWRVLPHLPLASPPYSQLLLLRVVEKLSISKTKWKSPCIVHVFPSSIFSRSPIHLLLLPPPLIPSPLVPPPLYRNRIPTETALKIQCYHMSWGRGEVEETLHKTDNLIPS